MNLLHYTYLYLTLKFLELAKYNLAPIVIDKTPRFIVGEIISMSEHPDSDHLHICQVDLKNEQTQIDVIILLMFFK